MCVAMRVSYAFSSKRDVRNQIGRVSLLSYAMKIVLGSRRWMDFILVADRRRGGVTSFWNSQVLLIMMSEIQAKDKSKLICFANLRLRVRWSTRGVGEILLVHRKKVHLATRPFCMPRWRKKVDHFHRTT